MAHMASSAMGMSKATVKIHRSEDCRDDPGSLTGKEEVLEALGSSASIEEGPERTAVREPDAN